MKTSKLIAYVAALLFTANASYASDVTPIVGNYGNVFPTLTEENLNVQIYGNSTTSPWYISFTLLAEANVSLGVEGYSGNVTGTGEGWSFTPTAILLSTLTGTVVQFGTDTFTQNPFPDKITQLVTVDNLAAGQYALEVNGVGTGAWANILAPDFTSRIQVLPASSPVPLPAATWLFLTGLVGLWGMRRKSAH